LRWICELYLEFNKIDGRCSALIGMISRTSLAFIGNCLATIWRMISFLFGMTLVLVRDIRCRYLRVRKMFRFCCEIFSGRVFWSLQKTPVVVATRQTVVSLCSIGWDLGSETRIGAVMSRSHIMASHAYLRL
jgi:hypothetical protein